MAFSIENTSRLTEEKLAGFVNASWEEDIKTVPGVGVKTAEKLAAGGIHTAFQLLGKFLMCKGKAVNTQEHLTAFKAALAEMDAPKSYVDQITYAIAKKADSMMPGLIDEGDLALAGDT